MPSFCTLTPSFRVLQAAGFRIRCPPCTWLDLDLSSDRQAPLTRMVVQLQRTQKTVSAPTPIPSPLAEQLPLLEARENRNTVPDSPSLLPSWTLRPDTQRWMEATATGTVPSMDLEFLSFPIHHHLSVLIRLWQNHPLVTALPSLLCGSVIIVQERPRVYYRKLHRKCHVRMSRGGPCIEEPHLILVLFLSILHFFLYVFYF